MDDNRKLARELFLAIEDTTESMPDDIDRISAYGEARYKAGVEAMRDAVRCEMGCDLDALAARLLEEK